MQAGNSRQRSQFFQWSQMGNMTDVVIDYITQRGITSGCIILRFLDLIARTSKLNSLYEALSQYLQSNFAKTFGNTRFTDEVLKYEKTFIFQWSLVIRNKRILFFKTILLFVIDSFSHLKFKKRRIKKDSITQSKKCGHPLVFLRMCRVFG